jgi:ADP-heptose:LPS heptosyltransferase
LKNQYKCKVIFRLKQNLSHFFSDKDIKTITDKDKIPSHDFHNHLVSLPRIFYKKNKNFPASVNFIKENTEVTKKWNDVFKKYKGLKVGINSTASTATTGNRIIEIEKFKYLTSLKKINFFIIQKDFDKNKMKIINKYSNVNYFENMDKTVKPFEDTIGIIKNLDLIITADTSLGHLAATLEKKTWIVLSFISDWRWFQDEKKSVWYENVALYKQKQIGNWEEVFKSIRKDLEKNFIQG